MSVGSGASNRRSTHSATTWVQAASSPWSTANRTANCWTSRAGCDFFGFVRGTTGRADRRKPLLLLRTRPGEGEVRRVLLAGCADDPREGHARHRRDCDPTSGTRHPRASVRGARNDPPGAADLAARARSGHPSRSGDGIVPGLLTAGHLLRVPARYERRLEGDCSTPPARRSASTSISCRALAATG